MKPKTFKEQNVVYAENQPEYLPLPALKSENGDVVTCWELSDEEIRLIMSSKCIYLAVKTFNTPLQPIFITAHKNEVISMDLKELWGEELYSVFASYINDEGWLTSDWGQIIENEIPQFDNDWNDNPKYKDTYQRMYLLDLEEKETESGTWYRPV